MLNNTAKKSTQQVSKCHQLSYSSDSDLHNKAPAMFLAGHLATHFKTT